MNGIEKANLQDFASKNDGDGYMTINGNIEPAIKVAKLEIFTESIKDSRRFLNNRVEQNAVRGLKVGGNIGFYFRGNGLSKAIEYYKNTGEYPNLTIQSYALINGKSTHEVLVTGVILDKLPLIILEDNSADTAIYESSFVANDFQIIE